MVMSISYWRDVNWQLNQNLGNTSSSSFFTMTQLFFPFLAALLVTTTVHCFVAPHQSRYTNSLLFADSSPSDYDASDLGQEKSVYVSTLDEDEDIRDALKRELLLLSSVTNRGEYASKDERDIAIDLVTQLEVRLAQFRYILSLSSVCVCVLTDSWIMKQ